MSAAGVVDEIGKRAFGIPFLRALRRWRGIDAADRRRVLGILNHRARVAASEGDPALGAAMNAAGVVLRAVGAIVDLRLDRGRS